MLSDVLNELAAAASNCATKPKNCDKCLYRTAPWRDDGHCYMFRDDFESATCGQYVELEVGPVDLSGVLEGRIEAAVKWLFSDEVASMSVSDARDMIRYRFGADVDEELRRRYA